MFGKKKEVIKKTQVTKLIARSLKHLNERLEYNQIDPRSIIGLNDHVGGNIVIYYVEDVK